MESLFTPTSDLSSDGKGTDNSADEQENVTKDSLRGVRDKYRDILDAVGYQLRK